MRRGIVFATALALLLLGPTALLAQGSITGSIQGTVKDPDGGVLPGVTVTVSSDALVAGSMTAVTDERGSYRFPSLPPGLYAVEASLAGFQTVRQDGVRVRMGQALGVDIVLLVAKVAEAITVTAEAPLVSVVSNTVATSFDTDFLSKQPLPRNYYNIIRSAPGVNIDYRQSSGSAMLAYGGTQERQNAFTLDGVNVADAGAGQHWILPAIQWMQEIQVGGLGAPAEYGGYTGGIINGITKSGGNQFRGEAEYYFQPEGWTSDNDPTTEDETFKFYDAAVSLGGPVSKDKLWYFVSGEYWNQVTTPYGATDTSDRKIPRFLGKLTLQASAMSRLMFMAEYEGLVNERRGIGAYTLPEASRKQDAPGVSFALHWESLVNANNFYAVKFTGYDGRDDYLPYNGTDTPGHIDYWGSEVEWYNAAFTDKNYRRVLTLDGSWSLFADSLLSENDSHSFKFGTLLEQGRSSDVWRRNGGFTYYDDSTACASPEAYFANPSCAVSPDAFIERGYGEYDQHPKYSGLALYAQDSMRLRRWTINAGLRYGSYKGGWQEGHGDSTVYDVNFVDPRIGFVWDVFGNARTALKAHWGRYHEKMFNYLFDREASGQGVIPDQDCYWNEETGDYTDCDEPVVQLATMGTVDHPYADESLLSLEQQLGKDMMVGVDLIDRRFRDLMAMINVNQDYELLTATGNPLTGGSLPIWNLLSDPQFVLTTDNGAYRDYQAAILRFEKRYSHGWQLRTSLVWTDLEGNILSNSGYEDEYLDRNGFTNASGRMERYSKWEYKLSGSVDLPFNFELSGQYTFLSGWYWTPYVRVRGLDYNASTGNYIWLTSRGSEQLPDRSLLDLRLGWSTTLGGSYRLTASLECFNVTNSDTVLRVSGRWGDYRISSQRWSPSSSYGTPTQIETPRQLRAGIRLEF
ncbi:MAG: TonB-dependent receptor [Thermoanaerobaculaceae bacterium]|nr:TonB-dependent receptor [Thermoanaerobaculaceae bacterium]